MENVLLVKHSIIQKLQKLMTKHNIVVSDEDIFTAWLRAHEGVWNDDVPDDFDNVMSKIIPHVNVHFE